MRKNLDQLPEDVKELVLELRKLSNRTGVNEIKLASSPRLLVLASQLHPEVSKAELIGAARALLERSVRATANPRDRILLQKGPNLAGSSIASLEERINNVWMGIDVSSPDYLEAESALDRLRYELFIQLAWRISGVRQWSPAQSRIELARRFQRQGRWRQGDDVLLIVVNGAEEPADEKLEAWRLLALSAWAGGRFQEVLANISNAVALCDQIEHVKKLLRTIDRLAVKFTDAEEYEMASELVSSALQSLPNNGFLWQRLGCIRWYSGDLIGSYSALTTALNEGEERSRVIHARGQVLAEMGKYQLAIVELNEALTTQRSAHSAAYLRSARAYAIGMSEDLEGSLREFAIAEEVIPRSAWLHYFKGLCYYHYEMKDEALASLRRSLESDALSLTRPKREIAESLVNRLSKIGG